MTNLEKMLKSENKSVKLFAETVNNANNINDVKSYVTELNKYKMFINECNDTTYDIWYKSIEKLDFKNISDIVFWLEEE